MPNDCPHGHAAISPGRKRATKVWHRLLLIVPFVWQIGGAPLVNDVAWTPFALPFPMAWQMAGIVVASLCIGAVYALDRRAEAGGDDGAGAGAAEQA